MNQQPPTKKSRLTLVTTDPQLAQLDVLLRMFFKPSFLYMSTPDVNRDVQIIISSPAFDTMAIQERVGHVFKLIKRELPEVLRDRLIVVQAYSSQQLKVIRGFFWLEEESINNA